VAREELDLLRGTLELHGFEILDRIRSGTDEALVVEEGALYPALHRMEKRGWLASTWGISDKGRRAKYYRLSRTGRAALERERASWSGYVEAVDRLARASGLS
jgi:transcriptional regulator